MPITAGSLLREKRTMAKNKEEKTNVMRVLEQKKIAYTAHSYPHEEGVAVDGVTVAKSMGFDPAQVFKTLVARGASGQYYVFDVPWRRALTSKGGARRGREEHRDAASKRAAAAHGLCSRRLLAGGHEEAVSDGFPQLGGKPCRRSSCPRGRLAIRWRSSPPT